MLTQQETSYHLGYHGMWHVSNAAIKKMYDKQIVNKALQLYTVVINDLFTTF